MENPPDLNNVIKTEDYSSEIRHFPFYKTFLVLNIVTFFFKEITTGIVL